MVELADTLDLGSSASACGFKSRRPHEKRVLLHPFFMRTDRDLKRAAAEDGRSRKNAVGKAFLARRFCRTTGRQNQVPLSGRGREAPPLRRDRTLGIAPCAARAHAARHHLAHSACRSPTCVDCRDNLAARRHLARSACCFPECVDFVIIPEPGAFSALRVF